ncbi:MAG: 4'-phosphopantetheinyl transferase superfamily protein, partial [Pseudomonadota bacterium]
GERRRAAGFHFERDRQAYIAAHGIGRALLGLRGGLNPRSSRFKILAHGKPELIVPDGAVPWRLNLSHTRGLAAAALTPGEDIGVDVEWLGRQNDADQVAERMFAAPEVAHVTATPAPGKEETFLAYWTLKEAYVKAIGKGLAASLQDFWFTLDPLSLHFRDPALDPQAWHLTQSRPTNEHLLAVAARRPPATPFDIQVSPAPIEDIVRLAHSKGPVGSGRI